MAWPIIFLLLLIALPGIVVFIRLLQQTPHVYEEEVTPDIEKEA